MFHFSDLFQAGFSLGAGLAAAIIPGIALVMLFDAVADHYKRKARRSRRRPPSITGNTEPLPIIRSDKHVLSWGKDDEHTTPEADPIVGDTL